MKLRFKISKTEETLTWGGKNFRVTKQSLGDIILDAQTVQSLIDAGVKPEDIEDLKQQIVINTDDKVVFGSQELRPRYLKSGDLSKTYGCFVQASDVELAGLVLSYISYLKDTYITLTFREKEEEKSSSAAKKRLEDLASNAGL